MKERLHKKILEAKVKSINLHIHNRLKDGWSVDKYDIWQIIPKTMWSKVEVMDPAKMDLTLLAGPLEYVRIRESVA